MTKEENLMKTIRDKVLKLIVELSNMPKGFAGEPDVAKIPDTHKYVIDDIEYYPKGYLLTYDDGKPRHSVCLIGIKDYKLRTVSLNKLMQTKEEMRKATEVNV